MQKKLNRLGFEIDKESILPRGGNCPASEANFSGASLYVVARLPGEGI